MLSLSRTRNLLLQGQTSRIHCLGTKNTNNRISGTIDVREEMPAYLT
jgi:hypothetical protein